MPKTTRKPPPLPATVWVLGLVSMLTDISSEMVSGLLPVFLMTSLGTSAATIGIIEGMAAATAMIVKVFSGGLSDWAGRRKPFVVAGYLLSALSKPLLAVASTLGTIVAVRLMDRLGKGVRDAPRDALIADITDPAQRGAAFGLRQSLDTVGAFVGPLLAMGLMLAWANDYRAIFWVACIPAVLSVALLFWGIHETAATGTSAKDKHVRWNDVRALGSAYWWLVALGGAFMLARFSEAFLVLRAQQQGLGLSWTPLVLIVLNLVYAAMAFPFGRLADRWSPHKLLIASLLVLAVADVLLAQGGAALWVGIALWGLHMAMSQGVLASMVANASTPLTRGTAFGVFYVVSGITMLAASALAGQLWDRIGPHAPFVTGAVWCLLTVICLLAYPMGKGLNR